MDEIKIEKGVPLPSGHAGRHKWPFGQMLIGNSFFTTRESHKARSAASKYGMENGKRFTCRAVTENGVKGVRVWRIE